MREQADAEKADEQKRRAAETQQTFKTFFDVLFFPDAKGRWKPMTAGRAEQHVRLWIDPVTGSTPFRELGLHHVQKIKANLVAAGSTPRTMQYVFRTFAMVWNAAVDHGYTDGPCPTRAHSFRLPKIDNQRQRYLTVEEEEKLLSAVKARSEQAYQMAIVSLDSGLRFGEVAALTWGCVDIVGGSLRVLDTKGKQDRQVPMTARLLAMFGAMTPRGSGALVFPDAEGRIQKEASSAFRTAIDVAGLNEGVTNPKLRASFHTLRHTYASRLVQAGVDLFKVQQLLGHSTPTMTARYAHLSDGDLRQAVQAMEANGKAKRSKGKVVHLRKSRASGVAR
jgi:integrase